MTDALIKIGGPSDDAPDGLARVTTIHYRPDTLAEGQRDRFDRRLDLLQPGRVPGHEVKLFADPTTRRVAWYARKEPEDEDGEYGPWERVLNVDME